MTRERYPLDLCLAAIVMTALGLSAAALNIQWGAAASPAAGAALRTAWLYVQVMAGLTWLLVWPAAALRPSPQEFLAPRELFWALAAMWIGMVPALATAALLSATPTGTVVTTLAIQAAVSLFALGILTVCGRLRSTAASAMLAGLLATLAIALPIAAFLWRELLTS